MIFIRANKNVLEKYKVEFEDEKLEELMVMVARKCGEAYFVKKECKRGFVPHSGFANISGKYGIEYYENIKYKESEKKGIEYDHYYEYEVPLYNCQYTKYICPEFVRFINGVRIGKEEELNKLFSKDFSSVNSFVTVEEKIKYLVNEISKCNKNYARNRKKALDKLNEKYNKLNNKYKEIEKSMKEISKGLSKLEEENNNKLKILNSELSELLKIRELNKNQEPVTKYINKLEWLVKFELVDTIDTSLIEKISSFFERESEASRHIQILKKK